MSAKDVEEIKKGLKAGTLVMGTDAVAKRLKLGKISKVFLCSNCIEQVKLDMERYAKMSDLEIVSMKETNEELGVICKKPFSIAVLGISSQEKQ